MYPQEHLATVMTLALVTLYFGRHLGALLFVAVPLTLGAYFILSTEVFTFGHNIPIYPYYSEEKELYLHTLALMTWYFLIAFYGKCLAALIFPPPIERAHTVPLALLRYVSADHGRQNVTRTQSYLELLKIAIGVTPIFFIFTAASLDDILTRDSFNAEYTWQRAMVFADSIFWLSVIAIPTIRSRLLKYVCLSAIVIGFASLGERQAPVAILVFVIIDRFILGNMSNVRHILLGAVSAWLLVVLISLRPDSLGGLIHVAARFVSPMEIPMQGIPYALNYMTNFSIISNTYAMNFFATDAASFHYSLSILPSFIHDESANYVYKNSLLPYVPFPGFAFLFSYLGPWVFLGAVFLLFLLFESFRNVFVRCRNNIEKMVYGAWVLIPVTFSFQYNLRACFRFFYFLLAAYVIVVIMSKISLKQNKWKNSQYLGLPRIGSR